jgi:hypothetical protein
MEKLFLSNLNQEGANIPKSFIKITSEKVLCKWNEMGNRMYGKYCFLLLLSLVIVDLLSVLLKRKTSKV